MIIVHPTTSLAKKLKVTPQLGKSTSNNMLGGWYANNFNLSQRQYILFTSETCRLPIVISAAPYVEFLPRFVEALRISLNEIGVKKAD